MFERYERGSREDELVLFAKLARDVMRVQEKNRRRTGSRSVDRAFHAKPGLAVENARLVVHDDLAPDLRRGRFRPGADLPVTVRLSNASGIPQPDGEKDLHGIALRVDGGSASHDLLLTSFEVSPAANAKEFVAIAVAVAGRTSVVSRLLGLALTLPPRVGLAATFRIIGNLRASAKTIDSLAAQTYWSRGAMLWGENTAVRYRLAPIDPGDPAPAAGPDRLRLELAGRLADRSVEFELAVQRYVSEDETPVEDTSTAWHTPWEPVARLVIPQQNLDTAEARLVEQRVGQLAFNPWNTTDEFRPLGNLNRARRAAYEASSAHRLRQRFLVEEPASQTVADTVAGGIFGLLNRRVPWERLPTKLGLLNLSLLRRQLRKRNLVDPDAPRRVEVRTPAPPIPEGAREHRTYDGSYNDLSAPSMGAVGARFGRNMGVVKPDERPDPVRVAAELLTRDRFIPASSLNVLAAAWIQFQVHDWVNHRRFAMKDRSFELPVPAARQWRNTPGGPVETVMRIAENDGDRNLASHWWDGSEVYGSTAAVARSLREDDGAGARLRLENGHLPVDERGMPVAGFTDSWWLGLSTMHTLFAREHNAVCDALRQEYPAYSEERIYQTGRLVVSALIAKIHTVDWTPAILATETVEEALNINWRGVPQGLLTQLGMKLFDPHALHGIPGSLPEHDGVPFSLTEEFVTVYRMHPLIPDDYVFVDHATGQIRDTATFGEIQGASAEDFHRKMGFADALYSLGIASPGAVTLHNFPRALQTFERNGEMIDLSVVDIVRTRRRGVPRYNDFRANLHKSRVAAFAELTNDPATLATLEELYGSIDQVDTVVGLLAEEPPAGFGFSDTAFRIFVLMASRRLQSDRFLTVDYRPEIYTPLGIDWVERGNMNEVLGRHCPELGHVIGAGPAAFAPWC